MRVQNFLKKMAGLVSWRKQGKKVASFDGPVRHIAYVGPVFEGGALDYAGRLYKVDGQEYFVRLFDYVDPTGKATIVVRADGYKKVVGRTGNDNKLASMKLSDELDVTLKLALRDYIATVYSDHTYKDVVLMLG